VFRGVIEFLPSLDATFDFPVGAPMEQATTEWDTTQYGVHSRGLFPPLWPSFSRAWGADDTVPDPGDLHMLGKGGMSHNTGTLCSTGRPSVDGNVEAEVRVGDGRIKGRNTVNYRCIGGLPEVESWISCVRIGLGSDAAKSRALERE
jgi:hypothetical protein